jgi:8-amino-7-oxononanoate synthase
VKLESLLSEKIRLRENSGLSRARRCLQSPQSSLVTIDQKDYLNFSSNDYLGLACSSAAAQAAIAELNTTGVGSGASHLISGHHVMHQKLEQATARFLNRDSAITFSTGYMANLAILQSLAHKGDLIIADKLNHASLIDGTRLSDAENKRYAHSDLTALESRLKRSAANKWVVTDGVFSMDGDIASLDKIAGLCDKYHAFLIVDDAHGIGVLGENGRGSAEHFRLEQSQLPVLMGTYGKALGGFGAFVSGAITLTDYLMQFARSYIYTTAMPQSIAAANLHNIQLIASHPERRKKLLENIRHFKRLCQSAKVPLMKSDTAIQPILIGDSERLNKINRQLSQQGILVGAIRPPTVAANSDRLRITLSASHELVQIEQLVGQLAKTIPNLKD